MNYIGHGSKGVGSATKSSILKCYPTAIIQCTSKRKLTSKEVAAELSPSLTFLGQHLSSDIQIFDHFYLLLL